MWQILHASFWKFGKLSSSEISLNWCIIDEVTSNNTTAYFSGPVCISVCVCVCAEEYRQLCGPQQTHENICDTFEGLCENGVCIPTPDGSFRCECQPGYKSSSRPNHCEGLPLSVYAVIDIC